MKKKFSDWNIIAVNKTDLDQFLSAIGANHIYEYRLLPETVTKNYTPEVLASRGIVLIPAFYQATIAELDKFILGLPEEIMVNLYDRCRPIKDKVMQLALSLAGKDSTKVSICMDNFESLTPNGHSETKRFGSLGTFKGYCTIYEGSKCFCLPFGSQTLIIKE